MRLKRIKIVTGVDVTLSLSKGLRWLACILRQAQHDLRAQYLFKSLIPISTCMLLFALLFTSCDSNRIFEENQTIPDNQWGSKNILKFDVDITDTVSPTNFYVNVRNADGYPYSNLFLFLTTRFPNGKIASDTLECVLADEKGQWLGSGMGDIYDNQIPFKKNIRFPIAGKYSFEIQHAMRVDTIPLIMDIGFRIEKAEQR